MKKSIVGSVLLAASCFSVGAWAGGESGIYIGGSIGQSSVEVDLLDTDFEDENTAYKILGGINFGWVPALNLAVEVDYRDFGEFEEEYSGFTSSITSIDLFGVVGVNVGPGSVFAKVGYFDADLERKFLGITDKSSESGTAYGIGAQFQLDAVAIRAEYEKFEMDDVDNLSMFSVGATYTF
ncbi:MAG TPA: outer membrane beta-barrel protein [Cellvibrionaceae bacterium]